MARRSVIVSVVRTPFGKLGGGLAGYEATELGAIVIKAALERHRPRAARAAVRDHGAGAAGGAGQARRGRRRSARGCRRDAGGDDQQGLRVVDPGDRDRRLDDPRRRRRRRRHGGMESMSNAPYLLEEGALRLPPRRRRRSMDSMVHDGLTSTFDGLHMVVQTRRSRASRHLARAQDAWAVRSHERAAAAQDAGRFADEIVAGRRCRRRRVDPPRHDRRNARSVEAGLRPGWHDDGGQRAGRQRRRELRRRVLGRSGPQRRGLEPLARILAQGDVADDFAYLARTPANAGDRARPRGQDDRRRRPVEINEAFASVAPISTRAARRRPGAGQRQRRRGRARPSDRRVGRPDRCDDGARLRRSGGGLGLAAICSGGGQGDALLIEV